MTMSKKTSPQKETDPSDIIPISVSLEPPVPPQAIEPVRDEGYVNKRVFYLSLQAILNAIIIGFIAKGLVALITLFTNLSFYGRFSFQEAAPGTSHWGLFVILVPVIGGLIVGLMARFGSAGIRGHGIPEAMEQVLLNESKISPIITFLKPISSAIAIGTGGPFGAEGPIIATGGAFGSVTGQIMRINANERKIILTSGACAGMAAIFGSPIAAVLLAIELLLFEFSPRSIIPVALACATGAAMHFLLFSSQPIFEMPVLPIPSSIGIIIYTIIGVVVGVIAAYVSKSVYFIEDMFAKLPIHWMWWPAIGAVAVGIIGYFVPQTMGVGYSNISLLLTGSVPLQMLFAFCVMKFISWSISLGSGTSGGTLAPLFTIGGGLGALLGILTLHIFPAAGINIATAALVGMAALFAGASRALLTSIVFALETTGQLHDLLPLLGACTAAYFVSFFMMKGSIMTTKIERRGIIIPGTFEPDIFTGLLAKAVMATDLQLLHAEDTIGECRKKIQQQEDAIFFAVIKGNGSLAGIVRRHDILSHSHAEETPVASLIKAGAAFAYPETPLNIAVEIMDQYKTGILPVVTHDSNRKVIGMLTYKNIFSAYHRRRNEEEKYKRAISLKRRGIQAIIRGKHLFESRHEKK